MLLSSILTIPLVNGLITSIYHNGTFKDEAFRESLFRSPPGGDAYGSREVGDEVVNHDGYYTDHLNSAYMSTTYTLMDDDWELMARSPWCENHEGNTTGEELDQFIEGVMLKHGNIGDVTTVVTDCEPSMRKSDRPQ